MTQLSLLPCAPEPPASKSEGFKPFDFQSKMIEGVKTRIKLGDDRILVIAGCGAGKTFIAANLIHQCVTSANKRCLFLVDMNCLVDQAIEELHSFGLQPQRFQGKTVPSTGARVVVASLQTIGSWLRRKGEAAVANIIGNPRLLIVDEAHDTAWRKSYEFLDGFLGTNQVIGDGMVERNLNGTIRIGLTATPYRLSSKQNLSQKFQSKVIAPHPPELIKLKRIVPARCFSVSGIFDISELDRKTRGFYDFSETEQTNQATLPENLEFVIEEWKRLGQNRPTVAYCSSVNHARALSEAFDNAGIPSDYQSGSTKFDIRRSQDLALKDGRLKVVCSVGTQTKGWNAPWVSCILLCRVSKSKALVMQCAGRGSRTYPGKSNYIVLDFGDNLSRLEISLNGRQDYFIGEKRQRSSSTGAGFKVCPDCKEVVSIFARICECGYEFHNDDDDGIQFDDDLEDVELREYLSPDEEKAITWFRAKKRAAFRNNISPEIPVSLFIKEYGYVPHDDWHYKAVNVSKSRYTQYVGQFHPDNRIWASTHMRLEFGMDSKIPKQFQLAPNKQWWEVLGVSKNAHHNDVKHAYLKLCKQYHPDVSGIEDSECKMKIINAAYDRYKSSR